MTTRKVQIEKNELEDFLRKDFSPHAKIIEEFSGNEVSKAYLFSSDRTEYVLRVDSRAEYFAKDKYAYEHFLSKKIIIPQTIKLGQISSGIFYSITKKLSGQTLQTFDKKAKETLFSNLAKTLNAIHHLDISADLEYGDWDESGKGNFSSWKEYLLSIKDSSYYNWDKLLTQGIYEKELFEETYQNLTDLSKYASEDKRLVHGDFGFSNILSDGKEITGILDWGISKYGDFIYDIAWLDYWDEEINYGELFKSYYKEEETLNYKERLLCYKLHIGLTSSAFFAKYGDKKEYKLCKIKVLKILESVH